MKVQELNQKNVFQCMMPYVYLEQDNLLQLTLNLNL